MEAEEHGSRRDLAPVSGRHLSSHSLGAKGGVPEVVHVAPSGWRRCFPAKAPKEKPEDLEVKQVGSRGCAGSPGSAAQ